MKLNSIISFKYLSSLMKTMVGNLAEKLDVNIILPVADYISRNKGCQLGIYEHLIRSRDSKLSLIGIYVAPEDISLEQYFLNPTKGISYLFATISPEIMVQNVEHILNIHRLEPIRTNISTFHPHSNHALIVCEWVHTPLLAATN